MNGSTRIILSCVLVLWTLWDTQTLFAGDKMIPCTLTQTFNEADMYCWLDEKPYCAGKEKPKCSIPQPDTCTPIEPRPATPPYETCTPNPPLVIGGWDAKKSFYDYKWIPDTGAAPKEPARPAIGSYIPVNGVKVLKWTTSIHYDGSRYLHTKPTVNMSTPYPGCNPPSTNIPWCTVTGWENAKGCTISHTKREFTLPVDQNVGPLGRKTIQRDDPHDGEADPNNIFRLPKWPRENQVEWVYGLADDGAPEISVSWVNLSRLFVTNTTTWCNINTYSRGLVFSPSPGCQEYASGANVRYGEDLFKNMSITLKDTSWISKVTIQIGVCSYDNETSWWIYHSCDNGGNGSIKTRTFSYNQIKEKLWLGPSERIDLKCLAPGKNAMLITAMDDARDSVDGIQPNPEYSILSVPGYIHIDNASAKLQLDGDFAPALYEWDSGNSFTGCFLNATGWTAWLKNTGKWVNYSVFGNLKIGDPYNPKTDSCRVCYFSGPSQYCNGALVNKPTGTNNHSIWTSPLGVDPKTGRYATASCNGVTIPPSSCDWNCESGYTRYRRSSGLEACWLSATCGSAGRTESYETPKWTELCLQWNSTGLSRTASWWTWQCESRDTWGTLVNKVSCLSYFPGQAECENWSCQSPSPSPSCTIKLMDRFWTAEVTQDSSRSVGEQVTLLWDTKNMSTFRYRCSGLQVPGVVGVWEGTMQAWAGNIPLVTLRDNVSCTFTTMDNTPVCTYANNNIDPPNDIGVCGEFWGGTLFQDIPPPPPWTTSPSAYCQVGNVVDFTNLAHIGSGTVSFSSPVMSGAAHSAYRELINAGNVLINGPYMWWCRKDAVQICTAWACANGMTYNPITQLCDGACAEWTITIMGEDGQKQCVSCDAFEGYEPYINEYAPGKFACYYYSSDLKFPYIGISNNPSGSGSRWHGTGNLWKDYSTLMETLRSFEKPKDLIEWPDIVENLSGSLWTNEKHAKKHQFIMGTGTAVGTGTTGFAIESIEKLQDITYQWNTFPKPCFNSQDKTMDPADVWIIEKKEEKSGCRRTGDPLGNDILNSGNLDTYLSERLDNNCDIWDDYTWAYLATAYSTFTLSSIAKPNPTKNRISYTETEEVVSFQDIANGSKSGDIRRKTRTYEVFDRVTGNKISSSSEIRYTRNCWSLGWGCKSGGNTDHSSAFLSAYLDISPYDDTCWEEKETVDFTAQLAPFCWVYGKSLSNCYKVTGYDSYGQEIRQQLPWHKGIDDNKSTNPVMYTAIYPYYWEEFYDTNIPTQFMDGLHPFLYKNNMACWLVFENTYRRDYIGMLHYKEGFAHDNLIHPYVYHDATMDGTRYPPKFRKDFTDHPDGVTMGLAENGTCSIIAGGLGWANAPKRKKPKIRITPPPNTGGPNPPVKMCSVWDDVIWAYVQKPCPNQ